MKFTNAILATLLPLTMSIPGALAAPVVIDTITGWDGSTSIGDFGASGFSAWGQFVTAPTDTNRLTDFTFVVSDALNGSASTPVSVKFQAHVAEYNPSTRRIVGSALYSSSEITVPLTSGLEFRSYSFSPDIAVNAGSVYLMFLFANNFTLQQPNDSRLRMASMNTDVYGGGAMNFRQNSESSFDELFTGQWFFISGPDLAFSATFDKRATAVPEPWSALLLGTAAVAACVARRRPSPARQRA